MTELPLFGGRRRFSGITTGKSVTEHD